MPLNIRGMADDIERYRRLSAKGTLVFAIVATLTLNVGSVVAKEPCRRRCLALFYGFLFSSDADIDTFIDTDGDGVSDFDDAFPTDPAEFADSDDDGVGDNADAFPFDPRETADTNRWYR